jgi:hypothetical protein
MSAGQVIGWILLVVIAAAVLGGFFYGGYRIIRREEWGWLGWFIGLWLIGFGWLVGLIFVLGPDRRYRQEVRAAARGEGYHPDYKRLAG